MEEDLAHELRSGQTDGVQEADGPEATSPQGERPPEAPPALSCLQGKDRSLEECERASKGSFTPLLQLKKFTDIPDSTREEAP